MYGSGKLAKTFSIILPDYIIYNFFIYRLSAITISSVKIKTIYS